MRHASTRTKKLIKASDFAQLFPTDVPELPQRRSAFWIAVGWLILCLGIGVFLHAVLGLVLLLVPPITVIVVTRRRQAAALSAAHAALPDALLLMASALSAGHTIHQAITSVRHSGGVLEEHFSWAERLLRLGEPPADVMQEMSVRLSSPDLHWVAIAIRINSQVGGDLGVLLGNIAGTMRERETLRRTARALSAEGRLSAWVLALLPPAFVTLFLLLQPQQLSPLVASHRGWAIIAIATALFIIGVVWLRRVVRLEL